MQNIQEIKKTVFNFILDGNFLNRLYQFLEVRTFINDDVREFTESQAQYTYTLPGEYIIYKYGELKYMVDKGMISELPFSLTLDEYDRWICKKSDFSENSDYDDWYFGIVLAKFLKVSEERLKRYNKVKEPEEVFEVLEEIIVETIKEKNFNYFN